MIRILAFLIVGLSVTNLSAQKLSLLDSLTQSVTGKKFPSFKAILGDGTTLTNGDLANKIVFINFWFVACSPCMAEMRGLNILYDTLKDKKDFLFLSFTFDTEEATRETLKKYDVPYRVIHITKEESMRMSISGRYPTNMILDKNGNIKWAKVGGAVDEEDASPEIVWEVYPKVMAELTGKN